MCIVENIEMFFLDAISTNLVGPIHLPKSSYETLKVT
jgi:hypothetical protein